MMDSDVYCELDDQIDICLNGMNKAIEWFSNVSQDGVAIFGKEFNHFEDIDLDKIEAKWLIKLKGFDESVKNAEAFVESLSKNPLSVSTEEENRAFKKHIERQKQFYKTHRDMIMLVLKKCKEHAVKHTIEKPHDTV